MYNAKDENITKNFRQFRETDINSNALAEWYKQMTAGNGPVSLHLEELGRGGDGDNPMAKWSRPNEDKFRKVNYEKGENPGMHPEVAPGFIGEQSPIKVDNNMETTLAGLYAVGDVSYTGSAAPGAVPAPPGRNRGSGILNAVFAGMAGGEHAAKYIRSAQQPNAAAEQIENSKSRVFAPLYRENGVSWKEIVESVKEIIAPVETSVYMHEDRLNNALKKLEKVKAKIPLMQADDFHNLLSCHEAEAMVLCAEMFFRASLLRKESRGWFLREDYPEMDNKNWLKWITVKNIDGDMVFDTENVPIDRYPIKPAAVQGR
jgi:succinate dehydrogenase/fumarate reductase flavoprotein subunit